MKKIESLCDPNLSISRICQVLSVSQSVKMEKDDFGASFQTK